MPKGTLTAKLKYLLVRLEKIEQLCFAQVRRISALEAQLDHLDAKRRL